MITIDYYSDILCIWAWIAQRRIDELNTQFAGKIQWRFYYMDTFGDTERKIKQQWSERGNFDGFARHVSESAAPFENAQINPNLWIQTQPKTSANAHLLLKAVEISHGVKESVKLALLLRKAFFENANDIGNLEVLFGILAQAEFDGEKTKRAINNGSATAALMSDYQEAKRLNLKGSPSYVLDNGRQTLYGNVGYRVLQANVEELLKNPLGEASWC